MTILYLFTVSVLYDRSTSTARSTHPHQAGSILLLPSRERAARGTGRSPRASLPYDLQELQPLGCDTI